MTAFTETNCSHCENVNGSDGTAENSADNSGAENGASPLQLSGEIYRAYFTLKEHVFTGVCFKTLRL